MRHTFLIHFKYKKADIFILTYDYTGNKWSHFFFIQI